MNIGTDTGNKETEKRIIFMLGIIYEWGFTKFVGDMTKQGYLLNKVENETIFDSVPEMMSDLKLLYENDQVKEDDKVFLNNIISSYEKNGISVELLNDVMSSINSNPNMNEGLDNHSSLLKCLINELASI